MKKIEWKQEVIEKMKEACLAQYRDGTAMKVDEVMKRLMDIEGVPMHYPITILFMPAGLLTLAWP